MNLPFSSLSPSDLTGCILAGGFGTRLRACVSDRPKVLAEVAGRPFLDYLLNQFRSAGVNRCVLCTGYLAEQIEAQYGESYHGMSLVYSPELTPLGTGGALRHALTHLGQGLVLAGNGDSFFDVDLRKILAQCGPRARGAALLLRQVEDASRYGRVMTDASGQVTEFAEKQEGCGAGQINAGLYVLPAAMIAELAPEGACSLEREVFPVWAKEGRLRGIREEGAFIDIGLPETYRQAQELVRRFRHAAD